MEFTVAANYDPGLIPALAHYPVREVYGRLPSDVVGGGRPAYMAGATDKHRLEAYVAALRTNGIAFNYLLNSACQGNREWGRNWQRRLMRLLDELREMGIRDLTVSTPYLLELVKARRPGFRVKAGIYAQIDTPRRARFWENLGADAINLESFSINRDFERLEAIREAVSCDLQLIPNHCCLPNCGFQPYHQNGFAHSSDGSKQLFVDYCFLRCTRERLQDPSLFLKAAWFRPEDAPLYEKLGITTLKLIERDIPSAELLRRVRAYAERRYDGNLADLLLSYGFREPVKRPRFWTLRHFFRPLQAPPSELMDLLDTIRHQGMLFPARERPITIDSTRLPSDFIASFRERDCSRLSCAACGYCERLAADAVVIDADFREEALRLLERACRKLTGGGLWRVE